jgi:hypothetical protein
MVIIEKNKIDAVAGGATCNGISITANGGDLVICFGVMK